MNKHLKILIAFVVGLIFGIILRKCLPDLELIPILITGFYIHRLIWTPQLTERFVIWVMRKLKF